VETAERQAGVFQTSPAFVVLFVPYPYGTVVAVGIGPDIDTTTSLSKWRRKSISRISALPFLKYSRKSTIKHFCIFPTVLCSGKTKQATKIKNDLGMRKS
jgi:hypothetical protein